MYWENVLKTVFKNGNEKQMIKKRRKQKVVSAAGAKCHHQSKGRLWGSDLEVELVTKPAL